MKKNHIIVTGGAGFVGSNLIEQLIKFKKFKIISLDDYSSGQFKNHIKLKLKKPISKYFLNSLKNRKNKKINIHERKNDDLEPEINIA